MFNFGFSCFQVHHKTTNKVAIDNKPFSIVYDQRLIELLAELEPRYVIQSTKYFNETMLPQALAVII